MQSQRHKKPCPGFELGSPIPFSTTLMLCKPIFQAIVNQSLPESFTVVTLARLC